MFINDGKLLGIDHAVEMAALQIRANGGRYVMVSLGFGDIIIQPDHQYEPLKPVENVYPLAEAPIHVRAVRDNLRNESVKYYAEIPYKRGMDTNVLKTEITLVLIKAILIHCSGVHFMWVDDIHVIKGFDAFCDTFHICPDTRGRLRSYVNSMVVPRFSVMRVLNNRTESMAEELAVQHFTNLLEDSHHLINDCSSSLKSHVGNIVEHCMFDKFTEVVLLLSIDLFKSRNVFAYMDHVDVDFVEFIKSRIKKDQVSIWNFLKMICNQEVEKMYKDAKQKEEEKRREKRKREITKPTTSTSTTRKKGGTTRKKKEKAEAVTETASTGDEVES